MPDINIYIRDFRNFRQMTQEELAKQIGKSKNVVSNWEKGLNRPDVDSVEKICKILHVTPNQLFGWEPLPEYEHYTQLKITARKLQNEIMQKELEMREIHMALHEITTPPKE
jgi:transcriptional regulator with XRE-family HTH domain